MRPTWRWGAFFLAVTCSGGQIRRLDRAKKAPFAAGGVPTAGECLKLISEFRQKVQKCNLLLTFCQFWGILRLSHCRQVCAVKEQTAQKGFRLSRLTLLGSRGTICG